MLRALILAARPKTLPASVAPVLAGCGLAVLTGIPLSPLRAAACLGLALLLQIAINFANDAQDGARGRDGAGRLGPARAVASGAITPRGMLLLAGAVGILAAGLGAWLAVLGGWWILAAGILALVCVFAYTGGPWPLAEHGLGEVAVFVFFGLTATVGTAWLQGAGTSAALLPLWWWPAAAALGCQACAILAINNLRDRERDAVSGKRTLAVRLGPRGARLLVIDLLLSAPAGLLIADGLRRGHALLPAAAIALSGGLWLIVSLRRTEGAGLNRLLARCAALELMTSLLVAAAPMF